MRKFGGRCMAVFAVALVATAGASSRPSAGISIIPRQPSVALSIVGSGGFSIYNLAWTARWSPDALHDEGRVRFRILEGVTTPDFGFHDSGNVMHSSATYRNSIAAEPGTRAKILVDWLVYTPKPFGRDEAKVTAPPLTLVTPPREPAPRLNSVEKDSLSRWARRSASVCAFFGAGGAVLLAVPGGQPVALAMLAVGGLGCGAALAFNSLSQDPVDPSFRSIAKASAPPPPRVSAGPGFPAAAASAFNALFAVQAQELGLARAILTAFNRSQGAHVKKQMTWEKKQVLASGRYAAQLSALMLKEAALRKKAAAFLDLEPVTENVAYGFGDGIVAGKPLPAQFTAVLSKLRLTKAEQAEVRAQLGTMQPQLYVGNPVTAFGGGATIADLRSAAASLKGFTKRAARDPLAIP
jgi:hypothetical protein